MMRPFTPTITAFLLVTNVYVEQVGAQVELGPEWQVNSYTTSFQMNPAVSACGDGRFLIAWQSNGSSGTDDDSTSIQVRGYDAEGNALGSEVQANAFTSANQSNPSIACIEDGEFLVGWQSYGSAGTDTDLSIQRAEVGPSGVPSGAETQVNTETTGNQVASAVSQGLAGSYLVVWESDPPKPSPGDQGNVHAQLFDSDGAPDGAEFQVNSDSLGLQGSPSVARIAAGGYVVVWHGDGSVGNDSDSDGIYGQKLLADGSLDGVQFQVNSYVTGSQTGARVASSSEGSFVVVWQSDGSDGADTDAGSIQAQMFSPAAAPVGSQFEVNSITPGHQDSPSVAMAPDGTFVAVWRTESVGSRDSDSGSIQSRRFFADGSPRGPQFQVNTYEPGAQLRPAVAVDPDGNFVIAWHSDGSASTDTDSFSIQAKRFRGDTVFRSGFEQGDPCGWARLVGDSFCE